MAAEDAMSGLIIAALGIALAAWHARASAGRISLHPACLKTPAGSGFMYTLSGMVTAAGALLAASSFKSGSQYLLIGVAVVFVAAALAGSTRGGLVRELSRSYEDHRKNHPRLDDEALYRFVVHDRHPDWENSVILDLTEDCYSLDELARRLEERERAP